MIVRQLKVLYVIDGLRAGGKERQLVEMLKFLTKNGLFSIGVITFNKNKHYSEIVKNLVPLFIELKKRPTRLEPIFTIWKYIIAFKPDIIHTWDSLSSLYVLLPSKLMNIKLIEGSIRDSGVDKGWHYLMKRFLLDKSDVIISNSKAGLKYYKVKGEVVYNIINNERFAAKDANNEFNIIMVANFTEYKDHKTFINSAIHLKSEGVINNVYLAGDGRHRFKYIEYINLSYPELKDSFHFLGTIENIESYLLNCKVGILCSTSIYGEGVSNSVLEYMAAGLVAIGTNIGGTPEIIEDGENGFLIAEGDENAIVEIVKKVKGDKELFFQITQKAKITIEEKFSYLKNCEKLINIYQGLCDHQ